MSAEADNTTWLLAQAEEGRPECSGSADAVLNNNKLNRVSCCDWLGLKAKALKKESVAIFYALQDNRTPWYSKILPFLALSYYLCPLDLIPDFIPILGSFDDMIIVPSLLWLSLLLIPTSVMEDARKRAKEEPLRLSKNWCAAVVVFIIWMCALETSMFMVAHTFLWNNATVRLWLPFLMPLVLAIASSVFITWAVQQMRKERAAMEAAAVAAADGTPLDCPVLQATL